MAVSLPSKGRSIGVYFGDSPATLVAGVRTKSIVVNGSPIDITNDDDGAFRKLLDEPGQVDCTISCSGIVKDQVLLQRAVDTSDRVHGMEFRWPGTTQSGHLRGDFFIESLNFGGEYQGAMTFEATFQSTGTVTYQPAA